MRRALNWTFGTGGVLIGALALAAATAPGSDKPERVDLTHKGFTARTIETPSGRMMVYEKGAGVPLVFIHGISGGASSYNWRAVAPRFADGFRVIAPDLVGWGASDHPGRSMTADDYAAQIAVLLQDAARSGQKPTVVAESLSAGFAASVANANPDLVKSLILLTPSGARDFGVDQFEPQVKYTIGLLARAPVLDRWTYRAVFHRRATLQSFWEGPGGFGSKASVESDLVDATWWSATRPNAALSALPFLSGALRYDAAPILRAVTVPATAIWAAREPFLDENTKQRLQAVNARIRNLTVPLERGLLTAAAPDETADAIARAVRDQTAG